MRHRCVISFLLLVWVVLSATVSAQQAIPNWPAPSTWASQGLGRGATTMGDVTSPLPFVGLTPCRIADTRGNGFTGQYGPPALVANANRNFTIAGQCGIPAGASAVSFNFAALDVGAAGDLRVFPAGGGLPLVSTLNYNASTPNIANAAVVSLGSGGAITVRADAVSINLIIDVNGYYASAPAASSNSFKIVGSGPYAIWGDNTSSTDLSTGVYGLNEAATGLTVGVWGRTVSTTFGAVGTFGDAQAASGVTYGVAGLTGSSTAGAAGVHGEAYPTTGATYGVVGYTRSLTFNSAGVYGVNGEGEPPIDYGSAGVRGGSVNGYGVVGISGTSGIGVAGLSVDSAGVVHTAGYLGLGGEGVFYQGGLVGTGAKSFVEPHPTDASKVIRYVSLEGPEAGTYFRGRGRFQRGLAAIELPENFRMVTDPESLSIQVTPIGEITGVAVVRIGLEGIVVKGSRDVEFFYTVNGVRRAYNHWDPIQPNESFFVPESPEAKLPKYLSEEETRRLIANGTYNEDGTVNMATAERAGWTRIWADREARARGLAPEKPRTVMPPGR